VRTTSHSGRTPRATASTGSNERARSSQATIEPAACASAASRSASVVLPELTLPRSATVADRGSPPVARIASSAAKPVETVRSSGWGASLRLGAAGANGEAAGSPEGIASGPSSPGISSGSRGSIALASAPSVLNPSSPPRRGAALPQRAWSVASASETVEERPIGRRIIERMFYVVKGFRSF
jgi:hypothetical protein